ncbi:unnamed protein product [Dibothriocephalus latus]|uniref:Uncharacterized protein n=1 Tax=Dibothriocephalus latus TaxID=60516 RepID=A0A3P7P1C8_DIBLA|nr:unnamed protein product [Dibothriocephalus latus]
MPSNRVRTRKNAASDVNSDLKGAKYILKDGELVPSGDEHSDGPADNDDDEMQLAEIQDANQPHRNKRKQTFERRNINEEAQSAQRAEMERRKRLQDKEQAPASNSSAVTTSEGEAGSVTEEDFTSKLKSLSTDSLSAEPAKTPVDFGLSSDVAAFNNGIDAHSPPSPSSSSTGLLTQSSAENKPSPAAVPSASASLFKSYSRSRPDHKSSLHEPKSTGDSQDNAILLGDSDDDVDMVRWGSAFALFGIDGAHTVGSSSIDNATKVFPTWSFRFLSSTKSIWNFAMITEAQATTRPVYFLKTLCGARNFSSTTLRQA